MMGRFLIDEDMPRSMARALRASGFDAADVRDVGLRGCADADVFRFALAHRMAIVTADLDFADVRTYALGSHEGIIVARFPNELPVGDLVAAVVRAVAGLADDDLRGALVVVEPHRIRMRQPPSP
ncbi:MAG: DUF5615 family PIN-like protein [Deltaproteobacteria bacterium]|nr:DUF5615 family PIN-like protein [Deltaproteobacteria bacterium]